MVNRTQRLGDQCLDGVVALLRTCILDAEGLGEEFQPGQWRCLADVVELPIVSNEAGRLADGSELQVLLERYYSHCFEDLRAEVRDTATATDKINEIMAAVPNRVARRIDHTLAARTVTPATGRLGDRCLRGLTALLTACLRDAESLGDGFKPRGWKILDQLVGIDAVRFEIDRLSDEDYAAFRELVRRYRMLVFGKELRRFWLPPRRDSTIGDSTPVVGLNEFGGGCLQGAVAMLTACVRDAEASGGEFNAKEWRCFDELVGVDAVRFELDQLNDGDYRAFLDLLNRYRQCVFPRRVWKKVPIRLRLPDQRTGKLARSPDENAVVEAVVAEAAVVRSEEQWKSYPFMRSQRSPSKSR